MAVIDLVVESIRVLTKDILDMADCGFYFGLITYREGDSKLVIVRELF